MATDVYVGFKIDLDTANQLAVPDGLKPDVLHITLAYLGELSDPDMYRLTQAVAEFAACNMPASGEVGGSALFDQGDNNFACVALVDSLDLAELREDLCEWLTDRGFDVSDKHGFIPHVTRSYGTFDDMRALPFAPHVPLALSELSIVSKDTVYGSFPLYSVASEPWDELDFDEAAETVTDLPTFGDMGAPINLIIGLTVDPHLARTLIVDGGTPADLLPLFYVTVYGNDGLANINAAINFYAAGRWPLAGAIVGDRIDILPGFDGDISELAAIVDLPELSEFHDGLRQLLVFCRIEHTIITASAIPRAYGEVTTLQTMPPALRVPLTFATVTIYGTDGETQWPLTGGVLDSMGLIAELEPKPPSGPTDDMAFPSTVWDLAGDDAEPMVVLRSNDERRYTCAPVYTPNAADTWDDAIDDHTLQEAGWALFRKSVARGSFKIQLQHLEDVTAGECVGFARLPAPMTVTMQVGIDGEPKTVTLPTGTIIQEIIWEPQFYQAAKDGRIRGLSLGGTGYRQPATTEAS